MDDVLVHNFPEEHLKHISIIFEKKNSGAELKPMLLKYAFLKKHLEYFGYLISGEEMSHLEEKVASLMQLASPTDVTETMYVIG